MAAPKLNQYTGVNRGAEGYQFNLDWYKARNKAWNENYEHMTPGQRDAFFDVQESIYGKPQSQIGNNPAVKKGQNAATNDQTPQDTIFAYALIVTEKVGPRSNTKLFKRALEIQEFCEYLERRFPVLDDEDEDVEITAVTAAIQPPRENIVMRNRHPTPPNRAASAERQVRDNTNENETNNKKRKRTPPSPNEEYDRKVDQEDRDSQTIRNYEVIGEKKLLRALARSVMTLQSNINVMMDETSELGKIAYEHGESIKKIKKNKARRD